MIEGELTQLFFGYDRLSSFITHAQHIKSFLLELLELIERLHQDKRRLPISDCCLKVGTPVRVELIS